MIVISYLVFCNQKFLAVEEKYSLSTRIIYLIVIYIVVNVSRPLKNQIASRTAWNIVLLEKCSAITAKMHSMAEIISDLIQKYMGMRARLNFKSYFLIEIYNIIIDLCSIPWPWN